MKYLISASINWNCATVKMIFFIMAWEFAKRALVRKPVLCQIDSYDQMAYVERLQIYSDNSISTLINEKRKWIRTLIRNTNCQTCWMSAGLALIFFPVRLNRDCNKLMALGTFCLSAGFRSTSACSGNMFSVAWEPPKCPFSWCAPFQFELQWGTWSLLQSVSWCALSHR